MIYIKEFQERIDRNDDFVWSDGKKETDGDGRIASLTDEKQVVKAIQKKFPDNTIEKRDNRAFADITAFNVHFHGEDEICNCQEDEIQHINVKIVGDKSGNCNVCGLKVFNLILFNDISQINHTELAIKVARAQIGIGTPFTEKEKQYWLFVISKTTRKTSYIGLTQCSKITVNPSNGLQIDFAKVKKVKRSHQEVIKFISGLYNDLISKKADPWKASQEILKRGNIWTKIAGNI